MKSAWPVPSIPSPAPSLTVIGAILVAIALGLGVAQYGILTLGIVAAPLALLAAWKTPGAVFAMYLAIPWYKGSVEPLLPIDLTVALALLCGVASMPLVLALLAGDVTAGRKQILVLWVLPLVVVVLGGWYSVATDRVWGDVLDFTLLVWLAGLTGLRVATSPVYLQQFVVVLFGVGVATVVTGMTELGELGRYERVTTLGSNTLGAARAALLVPLIGFTYFWGMRSTRPLAVLMVVALTPPALIVAISTGSRGPLLFFVLTVLIRWLVSTGGRQKVMHLAIAVAAAILVLTAPLPSFVQSLVPQFSLWRIVDTIDNVRISLQGQEADFDTSSQIRIQAWELATQLFDARPVLGWGTSGFAAFTPEIGLPDVIYPHNLALEIAANHGIVGLILMAAAVAPALRVALRRYDDPATSAVATLLLFSALQTITGSTLINDRPLWMLLAVGLGIAARPHHATATHAPPLRSNDPTPIW